MKFILIINANYNFQVKQLNIYEKKNFSKTHSHFVVSAQLSKWHLISIIKNEHYWQREKKLNLSIVGIMGSSLLKNKISPGFSTFIIQHSHEANNSKRRLSGSNLSRLTPLLSKSDFYFLRSVSTRSKSSRNDSM